MRLINHYDMKNLFYILFLLCSQVLHSQIKYFGPDSSKRIPRISGLLTNAESGYGEYSNKPLQKWSRTIGHPIGGISQIVSGYDLECAFKNIVFGIGCDVGNDFSTTAGPQYISIGLDLGYIYYLNKHILIRPELGFYNDITEYNLGNDHPAFLSRIHDVPDDKNAMLLKNGIAIHPGIKIYYFPNPGKKGLFFCLAANEIISLHEDAWEYGYTEQSGRSTNFVTSPDFNIDVPAYNKSWNVLAGIGVCTLYIKRKS